MKKEKTFSFLEVAIIVVITSVVMYFLGGLLLYKQMGGVNYSLLGNDANLKEFISAYNELLDNYYDDDIDKSVLIQGAIKGMYSKVNDPYTTYLDSENTESLNSSLAGKYTGIGIRVETSEDEVITISEVFEDSPAEQAGLKAGDIITSINGESTEEKAGEDISNIIKNTTEKKVDLTVERDGETLAFQVNLDSIMVPVVTSKMLTKDDHKVGYIKMSIFNDTADVQFESALSNLENDGMESLIIDLRSNTGGYLEVSKNIAEMFLEKGKVIYSLENKNERKAYKDETNEKKNFKVYILVNKMSASASEILAAALKYSYGAVLVGEKTYGKGKIQERAGLSSGTTVKYTTAKWLTPNGDCIDGIGLEPDYEVSLDTDSFDRNDLYSDSQIVYILDNLVR